MVLVLLFLNNPLKRKSIENLRRRMRTDQGMRGVIPRKENFLKKHSMIFNDHFNFSKIFSIFLIFENSIFKALNIPQPLPPPSFSHNFPKRIFGS